MADELNAEIWKSIPSFERYEASSLGRLKSCARECWSSRGRGYKFLKKERVLRTKPDTNGYLVHTLVCDDVSKTQFLAHRLVALAFIPNPEQKPFINHKNGIKTDNRPDNLEWCTKPENGAHAVATGLHTALRGEANGNSILRSTQVVNIRREYATGTRTQWSLAHEYQVGRSTIQAIVKGKLWAHI